MPVIGNVLPNAAAFRNGLAAWLTEQAALAAGFGVRARKGPELLQLLAAKVHGLPDDDQQLRALHTISSRTKPRGSADPFTPTPQQGRIIGNVGQTGDEPSPEEILHEILAAGIDDALVAVSKEQADRAEAQIAETSRQVEERAGVEILRAQEAEQAAIEKMHLAVAENTELRKERDHLATALEGKAEGENPKPKPKPKPKTKAVAPSGDRSCHSASDPQRLET